LLPALDKREVKVMNTEKLTLKISKAEGAPCACGSCGDSFSKAALERALLRVSGVSKANFDTIGGKVKIEYDPEKVNQPKITERLEKLGYRIENTGGVS
jgi:copper chaperone CopZ